MSAIIAKIVSRPLYYSIDHLNLTQVYNTILMMHSSQRKRDQRSFERVRDRKKWAFNSLEGSAPWWGLCRHGGGNIETVIGGRRLVMEYLCPHLVTVESNTRIVPIPN
jgi:hypothetical protein